MIIFNNISTNNIHLLNNLSIYSKRNFKNHINPIKWNKLIGSKNTILIDASQHRNAHHMDGRYAGDYFLSVYLMVGKGSSAGWVMVSDHGTSGPYSFSHVIGCRYGM